MRPRPTTANAAAGHPPGGADGTGAPARLAVGAAHGRAVGVQPRTSRRAAGAPAGNQRSPKPMDDALGSHCFFRPQAPSCPQTQPGSTAAGDSACRVPAAQRPHRAILVRWGSGTLPVNGEPATTNTQEAGIVAADDATMRDHSPVLGCRRQQAADDRSPSDPVGGHRSGGSTSTPAQHRAVARHQWELLLLESAVGLTVIGWLSGPTSTACGKGGVGCATPQ